jgi:hypothetical protein
MSEDATPNWVDPWQAAGRSRTSAESAEMELFQKQERLEAEETRRRREFDEKQRRERYAFDDEEYERRCRINQQFEDQMFVSIHSYFISRG